MTRSVIFETPGTLDLRAITCMGVNTKPNSVNPIGFFGTGLKYSVAVLAREGLPMTLVTDGKVYAFYRKTEKFRDKDFDFVRMKKETLERKLQSKTVYSELSYTTELGKQWKLWQVFRELYSNTLDEGGRTYTTSAPAELEFQEGYTYIIVTGEAFAQEYDQRDKTFLPDGLRVQHQSQRLQVLDRPSNHVYYRGMRVYDLEQPSALTYNFLADVELTEDRTAKNSFMLTHYIQDYIVTTNQGELVAKAVQAGEGTLEGGLNFSYMSTEPSETFKAAVASAPAANPTAASYLRSKAVRAPVQHPLRHRPRPWRVSGAWIVDAEDDPVFRWDFPGGLEQQELAYAVELLQGNLEGRALDDFFEEHAPLPVGRPQVVAHTEQERQMAEVYDDVPF